MAEIIVSKGKSSIDEILNNDSMFVLKGGKAVNTTVNEYGSMYVSSGGVASETKVNDGGSMFISKGGKAYNPEINKYGCMFIYGGTVSSATLTNDGYFVLSRGTINNISLNKAGGSIGSEGGTINDFTLNGSSIILHGGTINRGTVTGNGELVAYSGAKVNNVTFHNGNLNVWSNGTANKLTLEKAGYINVFSGAKVSNVIVSSGGSMSIDSGAVASNVTLLGGDAEVAKKQYAGRLAVNGTVKGLTIGSGTSIGLFYGCSATKVKWTPGNGVVNISSEAKISFTSKYSSVYLGSDGAFVNNSKELVSETLKLGASAYVAKGGVASGLEIASGGSVYVWNGGKALQTQVGIGESNSYLNVSSGGTASDVTIFEKGGLNIYSGGKASVVTICNGGAMSIEGGSADGIEVETGGALGVFGGTATNVKWTPFEGELQVWGNAQITFAGDAAGVYIGTNGVLEKNTDKVEGRTIGDVDMGIKYSVKEEMFVMSEGKTKSIIVGNNGSMYVFDGGSAGNTNICGGGQVYVYNGGSASIVEVSGGELAVFGGTATDVTLNDYGTIYVAGGSVDDVTVGSCCYGYITEGGSMNGATLCSGIYREGGMLFVSSGAVVTNLTLEYGACLYVEKGAKVTNVSSSYGSYIDMEKGATVKKITVVVAESPDTDRDVKNGWADKRKKTINKHIMDSTATLITESTDSIILDEDPMSVGSHDSFVGYTDEIDFKKVHLNNTAKLSFDIYATDASKFTIWRWDDGKKKLVSLQASTLKLKEVEDIKSGAKSSSSSKYFFVETKDIILNSGDYYLSMESTNAAKGGNAYYNVILAEDSQFFGTPDNKDDTWKNLSDDYGLGALSGSKDNIVRDWVGYDDAIDYRKFTVGEEAKFSFEIESSDLTKFTVWKYDAKKKKLVSLQTTSIEDNYWGEYRYGTTTDKLQLDAGEYYFSVESPDAKKGGNADYRVSVIVGDEYKAALTMPETASDACALAMPETSDELGISDALSFCGYDTDVLADASASVLAELDGSTAMQLLALA